MEKICAFTVDDRIFHRAAILKAAYLYTDQYYIHLSYADEHLVKIEVRAKPGTNMTDIDKRFSNDLLSQMLRYELAQETQSIRELVIGRALFSTCIDTAPATHDEPEEEKREYSLDDIAVDWFEACGNEENDDL